MTVDRVPIEEHIKYKYLLSIDGFTAVWGRVPWIMFSNSVLVKAETGKVEWFYDEMESNVHYVPLKRDLSDFVEKITYLKENDELARNISVAANAFVE